MQQQQQLERGLKVSTGREKYKEAAKKRRRRKKWRNFCNNNNKKNNFTKQPTKCCNGQQRTRLATPPPLGTLDFWRHNSKMCCNDLCGLCVAYHTLRHTHALHALSTAQQSATPTTTPAPLLFTLGRTPYIMNMASGVCGCCCCCWHWHVVSWSNAASPPTLETI